MEVGVAVVPPETEEEEEDGRWWSDNGTLCWRKSKGWEVEEAEEAAEAPGW